MASQPTPREQLQALLERVERAERPDRELDADILLWCHPELAEWPRTENGGWLSPMWGPIAPADHFTASVDAALALVERVLPGGHFVVGTMPEGVGYYAALGAGDRPAETAATPALAIIAALLAALGASPASPSDRQGSGPGLPENETPRERAG